jgi:hypothetical protein
MNMKTLSPGPSAYKLEGMFKSGRVGKVLVAISTNSLVLRSDSTLSLLSLSRCLAVSLFPSLHPARTTRGS